MVVEIDAVPLLVQIEGQFLIFDVTLETTIHQQYGSVACRVAQRHVADRYVIDATELTGLGMLLPERRQRRGEERGQFG